MMCGGAWLMMLADRPSPGMASLFIFYALMMLSTAARIVIRVSRYRDKEHREPPSQSAEPPVDVVGVAQGFCFGVILSLDAACFTVANIRLGQPRAHTLGIFAFFTIGSIWGIADTIPKLLRYRRSRQNSISAEARTTAPEPPSKGTVGVLAYFLLLAALLTTQALFQALPAVVGAASKEASRQAAMLGYISPLSLFFLSVTIRPFARLRGTMPRPLWRFAVAVAGLCAVLNLGLCVVWLLSRI